MRHGAVDVHGRLLTVDGFALEPNDTARTELSAIPTLTADLSVTTYLTPADQGITAGASPGGPAPGDLHVRISDHRLPIAMKNIKPPQSEEREATAVRRPRQAPQP